RCSVRFPTSNAESFRCSGATQSFKPKPLRCAFASKRHKSETKTSITPPQICKRASQTLTHACLRYPSPPRRYPFSGLERRNSGKNVRFFIPKMQKLLFDPQKFKFYSLHPPLKDPRTDLKDARLSV